MYITTPIFNLLNTPPTESYWMRIETHLVDGTVIVADTQSETGDEAPTHTAAPSVHPILARLRSLRAKARRLGVWRHVLADTERGLVDATLLLGRLGARIQRIIHGLYLKLKNKLREAVLERFRRIGLEAAGRLVEFFKVGLLEDGEYLLYCGLRELVLRGLRPAVG